MKHDIFEKRTSQDDKFIQFDIISLCELPLFGLRFSPFMFYITHISKSLISVLFIRSAFSSPTTSIRHDLSLFSINRWFLLSQILQNLFFRWLFLWHLLKDRCRLFCHSLTLSSSVNPTTCQLLCSVSISFFPFPILFYWHSFRRVLLIKQYSEGKKFLRVFISAQKSFLLQHGALNKKKTCQMPKNIAKFL